VKKFMTV